jgi:glycosyltransferase involved in cell wall biosynthesis
VVLSSYTVECFPFAVLEAMGAAVPAVCTCIGGLPELVEDGVTGYLVPPRDPRGLAEGIVRLLNEPGAVDRMGDAARARLEERFTLERSVRETERVLTELVAVADRPRRGGRHPFRQAK